MLLNQVAKDIQIKIKYTVVVFLSFTFHIIDR